MTFSPSQPCARQDAHFPKRCVLDSLRGSTCLFTGGKVPIRSQLIEASGSSEAWYVPPRLSADCGPQGKRSVPALRVWVVKKDGASFRLIDLA